MMDVESILKMHGACRSIEGCAAAFPVRQGHLYRRLKSVMGINSDRTLVETFPVLGVQHSWVSQCVALSNLHERLPYLVRAQMNTAELRHLKIPKLLALVETGACDLTRWGSSPCARGSDHLRNKEDVSIRLWWTAATPTFSPRSADSTIVEDFQDQQQDFSRWTCTCRRLPLSGGLVAAAAIPPIPQRVVNPQHVKGSNLAWLLIPTS